MSILGTHPYADKFPLLPDDELDALAESIASNGLRNPVVITPDGLILDGRNRARACEQIGLEPETVVYEGHDLAEYVIDCNTTRRHMTTGQRAMASALVLADDGRREGGRWKRGSVDIGTGDNTSWQHRLKEAGLILDYAPELAADVVSGEVPLKTAYATADERRRSAEADELARKATERREREEREAEAKRDAELVAKLRDAGAQYVADVESGRMTPRAAWAAHMADTEKERRRQAEIAHGWRSTCTGIAEHVRGLSGGDQYAAIYLREFHPHAGEYVPAQLQLTHKNTQEAIDFLTAVQKGLPS